ncbi:putative delta-60 repeat protein [Luteibacter jiangsuensis]|uniref:Delta-60 repeat protein n=1 Tax=Luteibacter jiangsuensis TaxID=637577 RepID=A0ABT9T1J0_9GAMM|nr:hypothetical protein [Luteibacter jiangsuensis]MDQ0011143.1 putative delta-60 repeat protein [Luteibacter jiangsuensis]
MNGNASKTHSSRAGGLDPTFGDNGMVVLSAPGFDQMRAYGVTSDARDDTVYVSGSCIRTGKDENSAFVMKLRADGSVDATFGNGGLSLVTPSIGAEALHVHVQPNGNILVHLTMSVKDSIVHALAMVESHGVPDETFGNDGLAVLDMEFHALIHATVTPLEDGRILVVGKRQHKQNAKIEGVILRLLANGQWDMTLNRGGILPLSSFPGQVDEENVQCGHAQGHAFVVAGQYAGMLLVRRYFDDGSIDGAFGLDGDFAIPINAESGHTAVGSLDDLIPADDGAFIVIGMNAVPEQGYELHGFLAGVDSTGKPDRTFNGGEILYTTAAVGPSRLKTGGFDGEGRFIAVGTRGGLLSDGILIGRYLASGALDTSFGELDGFVFFNDPTHTEIRRGFAMQGDRGILVSGQISGLDGSRAVVMRFVNT